MKYIVKFVLFFVGFYASYLLSAQAAPSMSMGYKPFYSDDFKHFNYVNPNAPKRGRLILPAQGGFDTLNPFMLKGDKETGVMLLTLDTLMEDGQDEPFTKYGLLAEDVSVAADNLSVTFRLNPRAIFTNGQKVTADDVVFSFNTLTTDLAASPFFKFYWADVKRVKALDNKRVRFDFKQRNAELPMILGQLPVFSRQWFKPGQSLSDVAMTPPIGSGPYILKQYALGKSATYVRNPKYWATNEPVRRGMYNFDEVTIRYYRDETARLEAFKAGEFDLSYENVAKNWVRSYRGSKFDDGRILKHEFPHRNSSGLQGFVLNTRRPLLNDIRVRKALNLTFDFEWVNQHIFYGQYQRSRSYFTNSELEATGKPSAAEQALLLPLKKWVDPAVFDLPVMPPETKGKYGNRNNLKQARQLLLEAGLRYQDGRLVDRNRRLVKFEMLTFSKTYERIATKWQKDLAKLGIGFSVRVVDPAMFQRRVNQFDFDIVIGVYGASQSPGNEQLNFHGCAAAKQQGSHNLAGVCDPAVERLLKQFISFQSRAQLVTASHALDRVLRAGYYVVPNWYTSAHRLAWWNRFGYPQQLPLYYDPTIWVLQTWWVK